MRSSFPAVQFPKLGHTRGALMRAALPYLLRGHQPPPSFSSHSQLASASSLPCLHSFFPAAPSLLLPLPLQFPLSALLSPRLLPASSSSPLLCVPRHTSPSSVDCRGAKCSVTKFYASNRGPQSTCWPCLHCLPPFVGFCAAYFCDFNVLIDRRRCPPSMVPPPSLLLPLWR